MRCLLAALVLGLFLAWAPGSLSARDRADEPVLTMEKMPEAKRPGVQAPSGENAVRPRPRPGVQAPSGENAVRPQPRPDGGRKDRIDQRGRRPDQRSRRPDRRRPRPGPHSQTPLRPDCRPYCLDGRPSVNYNYYIADPYDDDDRESRDDDDRESRAPAWAEPERSFHPGGGFERFDPARDGAALPPASGPDASDLERHRKMMEAWQ